MTRGYECSRGERVADALSRLSRRVRRVLVVDDDPEMVGLLSHMIRSTSPRYRVLRAYDGDEALALLDARRPDAIFLDLAMPSMGGYQLLDHLRATPDLAGVPVIVVTARDYETSSSCRVTSITREAGLSIGDMMECLKGSLDVLLASPHTVRGPHAAPAV